MDIRGQKQQFLLYRIRVYKDPRAFAELHKEHAQSVRRFLAMKLPVDQVEDALLTTFGRAWNYMLSSTEVEHPGGLFRTIARGVIAEFYRTRHETVSYDEHPDLAEAISDAGRGQKRIETQANVSLVRDLLAELPDEQALAITLRFVDGLPMADVAERIGKTTNATQVMVHRALKVLRKKFEPPSTEKNVGNE